MQNASVTVHKRILRPWELDRRLLMQTLSLDWPQQALLKERALYPGHSLQAISSVSFTAWRHHARQRCGAWSASGRTFYLPVQTWGSMKWSRNLRSDRWTRSCQRCAMIIAGLHMKLYSGARATGGSWMGVRGSHKTLSCLSPPSSAWRRTGLGSRTCYRSRLAEAEADDDEHEGP